MRDCQNFQIRCPIFQYPQQYMRAPIFSYPPQHKLLSVFFILAIPVDVRQYNVVLVDIFLMNKNVEHLFMCLWAICLSLVKWLFKSLADFLIRYFVFLLLNHKSSYIFWIQSLIRYMIYKYFSPILWIIFLLSWWSPLMNKCF